MDGHEIEHALAADEQRIATELVDTVIRDLFGVGLTLQSALPHVTERGEEPLAAAIEGVDRVIRTIRDVVFGLLPHTPPEPTCEPADSEVRTAEACLAELR